MNTASLRIPLHLAPALVAAFTTACASQQAAPAREAGEVVVEVERVLPKAESLDASAVEVTLKITNNTGSAVKVERVEYSIDTKEVSGVQKGQSASSSTLEASQAELVTFLQSIPFPTEKEAYEQVLEHGVIPANLEGVVVLSDGRKLPFSQMGQVATPTLPKFIVFDAQAARYEKEGLDVTLFLRLVNENVFPVTIEVVKYTVYVEDKKVKSEQASLGERLIQGGANEYEVSVVLDGKNFDKAKVKTILAAGKLGYKVAGKVVLSRLEIPFEHTGEVTLGGGE